MLEMEPEQECFLYISRVYSEVRHFCGRLKKHRRLRIARQRKELHSDLRAELPELASRHNDRFPHSTFSTPCPIRETSCSRLYTIVRQAYGVILSKFTGVLPNEY
jgi:hypothetical protein